MVVFCCGWWLVEAAATDSAVSHMSAAKKLSMQILAVQKSAIAADTSATTAETAATTTTTTAISQATVTTNNSRQIR